MRRRETVVTEGLPAERKEVLGGHYLLDVSSKARAVELAHLLPEATIDGCWIEVRPVEFSASRG